MKFENIVFRIYIKITYTVITQNKGDPPYLYTLKILITLNDFKIAQGNKPPCDVVFFSYKIKIIYIEKSSSVKDKPRTETYQRAIMENKEFFKGKTGYI